MVIEGSTQLFGVIGNPISHTLSPIMHNAALKTLNINAVYIPCHVSDEYISIVANAIRALHFRGVNVTIPFKQAISPYLDRIEGDAVYTRSVNTIFEKDGLLYGTSTDGIGFIRSLREDGDFEPNNKKVILVGAGGTAHALAYRLVKSGVTSIDCYNRNMTNAETLKNELLKITGFTMEISPLEQLATLDLGEFDLLVNTTSVGLSDDQSLIAKAQLHEGLFIYDVVYKKGGTRLIREAKEAGCRCLDGLSLLVYQGAASFYIWFNLEPPITIMKNSLFDYFGRS